MWIINKFDNIILKSANVDKGGGGKTLIHKMWIKRRVFNPSIKIKCFIVGVWLFSYLLDIFSILLTLHCLKCIIHMNNHIDTVVNVMWMEKDYIKKH